MKHKKLCKVLSVIPLTAFLLCAGIHMNPMNVSAHSEENAETEETSATEETNVTTETNETAGNTKQDKTKPVVNAAINNKKLTVEAYDESGIKAIYVNQYEFDDVPDGKLSVRLQQFDVSYQFFTIKAVDNAGNVSDEYVLENPYYDKDGKNEAGSSLPADANPSNPTNAEAEVKEYVEVKGDDGSVKLFYTFETESGKVFYLIIDRTENNEVVHFVTDVSENDLLNTTSDNSQTLPQNSAATNSYLPTSEIQIKEEPVEVVEETESTEELVETQETEEEPSVKPQPKKDNPIGTFLIIFIFGGGAIGGWYYLNVAKKKEDFIDEEDDEEEDEEIEEIDDEEESKDNMFFDDKEDSESE